MAVWRVYCGTGVKPVGNRENKHDPNQLEKPIHSTNYSYNMGIYYAQKL